MRRLTGTLVFALAALPLAAIPSAAVELPTEWAGTPEVFEVDRLPATVRTVPEASVDAALSDASSPWLESLNGEWSFDWSPNPDERPEGFEEPSFDVSSWDAVDVPHNWQIDGYGDEETGDLVYLNQEHPWQGYGRIAPPEVPIEHNSVGSYRRTFELPEDWDGRRTILNFQGVKSAFYVWVNGEQVGYSEDSYSPAEFDVTDALVPGTNTVAVEVYRWSDGAWLENQDMIDVSGIFRDVELYSVPALHLDDHTVRTTFDEAFDDATLDLTARVQHTGTGAAPAGATLRATLYDDAGAEVVTTTAPVALTDGVATLELTEEVDSPAQWSAEHPNLYTLVYELLDAEGETMEVVASDVGFRQFEIVDEQMTLNGQVLDLKGVNRGEFHPDTGQALTREQIRQDLELMRRHNITAVRTAHYPAHPALYEIADEIGMYVMDEANLETHDMRPFPGNAPAWYDAVFDRTRSMYERDKNHASVIMWSMGNEVGSGPVFQDMAAWLGEVDPGRLLHFQQDNALADVEGRFYPPLSELENRIARGGSKPWIMSEYEHAMGNSVGNIAEYWELIDSDPELQGGFIWDWADQAVRVPIEGGHRALPVAPGTDPDDTYFSYGGDWGDYASDGWFALNGLVSPDRTVQAELLDVKAVYAPVDVAAEDLAQGRVQLRNEYLFTDLSALDVEWTLHADDELVDSGTLDVELAPLTEGWVDLPVTQPADPAPGTEYWVTLRFTQPDATEWSEAGHEVVALQLEMPWAVPEEPSVHEGDVPAIEVTEGEEQVTVTGGDFELVIDTATGRIESFVSDGVDLLLEGPRPDFWRPPTQNDVQNGLTARSAAWRDAGQDWTPDDVVVREVGDDAVHVQLTGTLDTPSAVQYRLGYFVFGSGDVVVRSTVGAEAALTEIPAVGMEMTLGPDYDELTWYGRGPQENYWDRHDGALMGRWSFDVADLFFPQVVPQATGNHTGVRWATLTDDEGNGLLVAGEELEVTALHQSERSIEAAAHPYEVVTDDEVYLTVDARQQGLGNSWSDPALPEYTVRAAQPWSYQYLLRPVTADADPTALANRRLELDLLADLRIDGETAAGFHTDVTDYVLTYSAAVDREVPVIEVDAVRDDVTVEITQADDLPGTATVTATSADGLVSTTYTIEFRVIDELYLSDIEWESATTGWGTVGRDMTVEGEPIQLLTEDGVTTFEKGLGVHADARIEYDLSQWDFDTFTAQVGVEQHAGRADRRFVFEVWVDGELAWESPVMYRSTVAVPISIDVAGASDLALVMRTAGDGNGHGHGAWGNPLLSNGDEPPPTGPEVSVTAATRCVVGRVVETVRVTNESETPVEVEISTSYGTRSVTAEPDKAVAVAFSTRSGSVPAGEVSVTASADASATSTTATASYAPRTCG